MWSKGSPHESQTVPSKYYFVVTDCVTWGHNIPVVYSDLKCVQCLMKNALLFRFLVRGPGQTDTKAEQMMIS